MTGVLFLDELSSVVLPSTSEQLAMLASAGRVLMTEAMLSGSDFRYINHALSSESLSSSDDGFDPTTGSSDQAFPGPHYRDIDDRPVYRPRLSNLERDRCSTT